MQTYNSFNALVAGQSASSLKSDMSVFNTRRSPEMSEEDKEFNELIADFTGEIDIFADRMFQIARKAKDPDFLKIAKIVSQCSSDVWVVFQPIVDTWDAVGDSDAAWDIRGRQVGLD